MKRRHGYTRLSSKNQVTIPLEVVRATGASPGDEFKVVQDDGRIVLEREQTLGERRLEAIEKYSGIFKGMYPPGYLDKLRDEWER